MKVFISQDGGCFLNYQHSYIRDSLEYLCSTDDDFELTDKVKDADIIVITSGCASTQKVIDTSLKYISKVVSKKKKDAKIYLTGCIANEFTSSLLSKTREYLRDNIDYVFSLNEADKLIHQIVNGRNDYIENQPYKWVIIENNRDFPIGKIFLSDGCLNKCSFCKMNFQKRPLRSIDPNHVKDAIDELSENGINCIGLYGTNVSQYGLDINGNYLLPEIIEHIEKSDKIGCYELAGFGFKDAIEGGFSSVLRDSSKLAIITGGLESLNDRLLSLMNKGYTRQQIMDFIKTITDKHKSFLDVSILAGFPTETIDDIKETVDGFKQLSYDPLRVSIYRYMNSPYIPSSNYEQLSKREIENHGKIYRKELKKAGINVRISI